jgi:hypothetical protein
MHETHERTRYSRFGTLVFLALLVFPFIGVGWQMAEAGTGALVLYAIIVGILFLSSLLMYRFAPVQGEPDPPASLNLETFDSERDGVPW